MCRCLCLYNSARVYRSIVQRQFYAVSRIVDVVAINLFSICLRFVFFLEFGIEAVIMTVSDLFSLLFFSVFAFLFILVVVRLHIVFVMFPSEQSSKNTSRHKTLIPFAFLLFSGCFILFRLIITDLFLTFLNDRSRFCRSGSLRHILYVICLFLNTVLPEIRMKDFSHHFHGLSPYGYTYDYSAENQQKYKSRHTDIRLYPHRYVISVQTSGIYERIYIAKDKSQCD